MYSFRLTEEIARWAFEVKCRESDNWYIAFTNPTAGPWKTIKCLNANGIEGEVYRFDLEENRPDIVLVNDSLELVIIIEAKDSIQKITADNQINKSVEVVSTLSAALKRRGSNPFWGRRADYTIITGLLWGVNTTISPILRERAFDLYHNEIERYDNLDQSIIIGIEIKKYGEELSCSFHSKIYGTITPNAQPEILADSFNIPINE